MKTTLLASAVLLACSAFVATPAQAGAIVGGSTLLDAAGLAQLQTWLGAGDLTLTNIFTKQQDDTSLDFHAAVDGQGPTITLMSATDDGVTATIGGYNPESWGGTHNYRTSSVMSAFIFNVSDSTMKQQSREEVIYNAPAYGPTFGAGHDIFVNSSLLTGYSYGFSYGDHTSRSIVSNQPYSGEDMSIGALEVFAISATAVPEPATLGLLLVSLTGLIAAGRTRAGAGTRDYDVASRG